MTYDPKDGILSNGETVTPKLSVKGDPDSFIKFNLSDVDFGKIHDAYKKNPSVTLTSRFEDYTSQNSFPPPKVKTPGQPVYTTELDEEGKIISTNVDQFPAGNTPSSNHEKGQYGWPFHLKERGSSQPHPHMPQKHLQKALVDSADPTRLGGKFIKDSVEALIKAKNKFTDSKNSPFLTANDAPVDGGPTGGHWPDLSANKTHDFEKNAFALINIKPILGSNQGYYKDLKDAPEGAKDVTLEGNTGLAAEITINNTFKIPEVPTSGQPVYTTFLDKDGVITGYDADQFPAGNTPISAIISSNPAAKVPFPKGLGTSKDTTESKSSELHQILSYYPDTTNPASKFIEDSVKALIKAKNKFTDYGTSPFLASSDEPTLFEGGSWPDLSTQATHAFEAASLALINVPFTLGSNQGYYKSLAEAPAGTKDVTLEGNTGLARILTEENNIFKIPDASTPGQSVFTTHLDENGKIISDDPDQFPAINTLKANTKSKIFTGDSPPYPALELGEHSSTDKGHKLLSNVDPTNTTGEIKTDVQTFLKSTNRFIPGAFSTTGINSTYIKDFLDPVNSFKVWTDLAKNNPFDTHDMKKFAFDPGYSYAGDDLGKYFKNPQYDDKPAGLLSVTYEGLQKLKENEFHVSLNQPAAYTPPQPGVDGVISHEVFAAKKDVEFTGMSNSILEGTPTGLKATTAIFSKILGARTTAPEVKQKLHELLLGDPDTNDQLTDLGTALEELTTNTTRWPIKSPVADTKPGFVQPAGFKVHSNNSSAWPDLGNLKTEANTKITLQPGTYGPNKSQGYYKSEAIAKAATNPHVKTVDYETLKGLAEIETVDSVYGFGKDDSFTSGHSFVDSFIKGNQPFDQSVGGIPFDPVKKGILPEFEFGVSTEIKYKKDDPLLKTAHTLLGNIEGNDSGIQASEINNVVLQPINQLLKNTRRWDGMAPTDGSDTKEFLPAEQIPALFKGGNWSEFGDPTTVPAFETKEIAVHNMDLGKYGQSTDDVTNDNAESVTLYNNRFLAADDSNQNTYGLEKSDDKLEITQFSDSLTSDLIGNEAGGALNKYSLEDAMSVALGIGTFTGEGDAPTVPKYEMGNHVGTGTNAETFNTLLANDDLYDPIKDNNIPDDVHKFIAKKQKFSPGITGPGSSKYQKFIEEDKIWPDKHKGQSAFSASEGLNVSDQYEYNKHGTITKDDGVTEKWLAIEAGTLTRLGKYYKNASKAKVDTNPNAKDVTLRRMKKLGSLRTRGNTLASTKPGDTGTEGVSKDGAEIEGVYIEKTTMGLYFGKAKSLGSTKFAPEMKGHGDDYKITLNSAIGYGTKATSVQQQHAKKRMSYLKDLELPGQNDGSKGPGTTYFTEDAYTGGVNANGPRLEGEVSKVLKTNRFNPGKTSPYVSPSTSAEDFQGQKIAGVPKDISGFGKYSKSADGVTLEDMTKIGLSLMMKASGQDVSLWQMASEDPTDDKFEAAATFTPSLSQLATVKLDPKSMYATKAFKAPRTNSDGLDIDLTSQNEGSPYELFGSVGSLNNPMMISDGWLPLGMVVLAAVLATAASLLVQAFAGVFNGFSAKRRDNPILFPSGEEAQGTNDERSKKPLGMYFDRRLGTDETSAASSLGASGFFTLSDIGINPVQNGFAISTKKGVEVLFGITFGTAGAGGGSFVNVIRSPAFYAALTRAWVMSGNQLAGDLTKLVKTFKSNPAEGAQSAINLVDKLKSSKLIGMLNVTAQIGDASFRAIDQGIIDPATNRLRHHIASNKYKRGGPTRIRYGGMNMLGAASAPSLYILPASLTTAYGHYGRVTSARPVGADTRNPHHVDYNILQKNYNKNNFWDSDQGSQTPTEFNRTAARRGKKRFPIEMLRHIEDMLESEYMPFYFHDLRTNEIIAFQAFLANLQDSYAVKHQQTDAYGRVDPVMVYQSTTRSISIDFFVVAVDDDDFDEMWWKINKLVTLVYPQYDAGRTLTAPNGEKFVQPFSQIPSASPLIRLRLGDIFKSNYTKFALARLFGVGTDSFEIAGKEARASSQTQSMQAAQAAANKEKAKVAKVGTELKAGTAAAGTKVWVTMKNLNFVTKKGDKYLVAAKADRKQLGIHGGKFTKALAANEGLKILGEVGGKGIVKGKGTIKLDVGHMKKSKIHYAGFKAATNEFDVKGNMGAIKYASDVDPNADKAIRQAYKKAYDEKAKELGLKVDKVGAIADFFDQTKNAVVKSFNQGAPGRGLAGVIKSIKFDWLDNFPWNIAGPAIKDGKGPGVEGEINNRAPKMCKVSISYQPIHDISPGIDADGANRAPVYNVGRVADGMTAGQDTYDGGDKGTSVVDKIKKASFLDGDGPE
jgi:hypothetical protein